MDGKKGYDRMSNAGNALMGTMRAAVFAHLEVQRHKLELIIKSIGSTEQSLIECEEEIPQEMILENKGISKQLSDLVKEIDCIMDRLNKFWTETEMPLYPTSKSAKILDDYSVRKKTGKIYEKRMDRDDFEKEMDKDTERALEGMSASEEAKESIIESIKNGDAGKTISERASDCEYELTDEDISRLEKILDGTEE